MTTKPGDVISIIDQALGCDESQNAERQFKCWAERGDALVIQARDGSRWLVTATSYPLTIDERDHYAAAALLDTARSIYGKARPRARTVGGPALDCIVDKPLIDSLGPLISKADASNMLGLQAIQDEGAQARRDSKPIEACPTYVGPIGARCVIAWRAGWEAAGETEKESKS